MSTTRRGRQCSGTVTEPEQYLPVELLLEIVARSDVTTVLRCATTSRILRRAILDPAFRRRLADDGGGDLDPALLVAVSCLAHGFQDVDRTHHVIHTQPRVRLDALSLPDWFELVTSRDGLLLLRVRVYAQVELQRLHVSNTFNGHAASLPPIALSNPNTHVFLSVSDGGASYEVLLADADMRFQIFSSKHHRWGTVRNVSIADHQTNPYGLGSPSLAVVGRTVYWQCCRKDKWFRWEWILALDVDAATGTIIEIPPAILMARKKYTQPLLASVGGFLSLLLVESSGISMWTLTPASSPPQTSSATWSRRLVINKSEVEKVVGPMDYTYTDFVLHGLGERSGAVIVQVGYSDLLRLDLATKVVKRLHSQAGTLVHSCVFLHEMDLVSLLQGMKCS